MKKYMMITLTVIVALLLIAVGLMVFKRIAPIGLGVHRPVYHTEGIALDGYDVTTYFNDKPIKGSSAYTVSLKDVTWYFLSEENRKKFIDSPNKFIPAFGGYCTKAVSTGFAAPADPGVYTIYEGRLFIFSSKEVKEEFLKDPVSLINACSNKWKE